MTYRAPWPDAWGPEPPHRRAFKLLASCALFLLLFLACVVSAVLDSEPFQAVLFGIGVLLFALLMTGFWRRQFRVRERDAHGIWWDPEEARLVIDYQRAVSWRLPTPRLGVSPHGVRLEHGRKVEEVTWTGVQLIRCGGEIKDFSLSVVAFAPGDRIRISGETLGADPALVAQLLQFYLDHEEARPELASTASLERVREGRFTQ
jgi:hypothetical protein